MNQQFAEQFIAAAESRGVSKQAAVEILNAFIEKQAAEQVDSYLSAIFAQAGVTASPQAISYTEGLLKAAFDAGCSQEQAAFAAVTALSKQAQANPGLKKQASQIDPDMVTYINGFIEKAAEFGLDKQAAYTFLVKSAEAGAIPGLTPDMLG